MTKNYGERLMPGVIAGMMALTSAGGVQIAQADTTGWVNSREINNSQISAFWAYNWTHSYSTCTGKTRGGVAVATQDGYTLRATARAAGIPATVNAYGSASNHNDGASAI